jgi:hypothetical protein
LVCMRAAGMCGCHIAGVQIVIACMPRSSARRPIRADEGEYCGCGNVSLWWGEGLHGMRVTAVRAYRLFWVGCKTGSGGAQGFWATPSVPNEL